MKLLVLGTTDAAGREIVRDAIAQGHTVVALVRAKARSRKSPQPNLSWVMRATRMRSIRAKGAGRGSAAYQRQGKQLPARNHPRCVSLQSTKRTDKMTFARRPEQLEDRVAMKTMPGSARGNASGY